MAISIYGYLDYKQYIADQVKDLGEPWGYWGKLAAAIACQPAYLSRCLKDKTNLTTDQVLALSRFWSLSNSETEYLVYLLEMAKSGTAENKKYFLSKLAHLKKENENLKKLVNRDSFERSQDQALYYSNWLWMAIHFACSIEEYQKVQFLSEKFHISPAQINFILEKLLSLGLVIKNGDRWLFNSGEFHLEKGSPLVQAHHQNWRGRAVADSQNPESDGIHYSAVYTLSKKDFLKLRAEVLKWITQSNSIVEKSKEEELICMNLDCFRL